MQNGRGQKENMMKEFLKIGHTNAGLAVQFLAALRVDIVVGWLRLIC